MCIDLRTADVEKLEKMIRGLNCKRIVPVRATRINGVSCNGRDSH